MTPVTLSQGFLAATGCDNDHLAGMAAIECLDERVQPVTGATPVQRCDGCFHLGADWTDEEAATAVGTATGGRVLLDPSMFQPFVLLAVPASRSVADLSSDSAPGERRERGVPGQRPSEAPDVKACASPAAGAEPPTVPAATHPQAPASSSARRVAARSTRAERDARPHQFPIAGAVGIPNPGG